MSSSQSPGRSAVRRSPDELGGEDGRSRFRRLWFPRARHLTLRRPVDMPEGGTPPVALRREHFYKRALAAADALGGIVAIALPIFLLDGESLGLVVVAVAPAIVAISKAFGLYDRDEHLLKKSTLDEAPKLLQVAAITTLLVSLSEQLVLPDAFDSIRLMVLWVSLLSALLIGRLIARWIARMVTPSERCLAIGDEPAITWLRHKLEAASIHATFIGYVTFLTREELELEPTGDGLMLGTREELGAVLASHEVDRVVIAAGSSDSEVVLATIRLVKSLGVKVSVLPGLFEAVGSSVEFDNLDGMTLLGVRRYGLTPSSRLVKRTVDVVGAVTALLLMMPLGLAAALAIRLTSPGPILFRQPRMGRDGSQFSILKFRTMVVDAEGQREALRAMSEAEGFFKMENDPRVTPIGRLLRKTSLDELPQLINVLRGDMSLVGPRPLPLDEDNRIEGWERRRLLMLPGITGLWQIFGSSRIPMREMVKIDYLYGANWSLWLDLKILLRTVPYVLRRRGR